VADKDVKRLAVRVPLWHHRRLEVLAYLKGTTPTALAGNMIQSRIESGDEQIERMLQDVAAARGISAEELLSEILGQED
jgi:hypothetical protein